MANENLVNIETQLAHQERGIAELNNALTSQQSQIATLELLVSALRERVKALSAVAQGSAAEVEIPPHY